MFEELAKTTRAAGLLLSDMHTYPAKRARLMTKLSRLEKEADTICHSLYKEAERTFITPIDREDIHALAKHLDDIVDATEECGAKLFLLTGTAKTPKDFQAFTKLILATNAEVASLVSLLKGRGAHTAKMRTHITKIHDLEHEGDDLLRASLGRLFSRTKSPVAIIKWKDIYETLESTLDNCEHVADVVDFIIIKNF